MIKIPDFPELTFTEDSHTYRLNGVEIPSVTTLMKPLSQTIYGSIDTDILAKAAKRGTEVHAAIENYIKFGITDITPEHQGYFNAFLNWYKAHNVKAYGTEIRLYHKLLQYAGTADMLANVDGGFDTLIDFKTSSQVHEKLCAVQLEAYERALVSHDNNIDFGEKQIIHLRSDGSYSVYRFNSMNTRHWKIFNELLDLRQFMLCGGADDE